MTGARIAAEGVTGGPIELVPTHSSYGVGDRVTVDVRGLEGPAEVKVLHLGDLVRAVHVHAPGVHDLGTLDPGGYSLALGDARTAVDVVANPRAVLRYGFVADYRPGRDLGAVTDNLRRLHLTAVQFYDWAYRHADLLGGGPDYLDALDQPISLETVRALVHGCHEIGSDALGYAAVYGVGEHEWPRWRHDALLTAAGTPYSLADFLQLVDPAAPDWADHFTGDLVAATQEVGLDGFHLDQYGYPKLAVRADGEQVDLSASFCSVIEAARDRLPDARLVFNNVNDFPTWATAHTAQDAVYIEVWDPHVGYEHLAQTVTRARAVADRKPVVVAAYQHVYADGGQTRGADLATRLTMATLFSHGATHLLCGEADRILVDPYYVRNHVTSETTAAMLRDYYDFLVAHEELLLDPEVVEVTASLAGPYNDDLEVSFPDVGVASTATAGTLWRRIVRLPGGQLAVHLINLVGQSDTGWDAGRGEPTGLGDGTLRLRRLDAGLPRVRCADPDRGGVLVDLPVRADGDHAVATIPEPFLWSVLLIDLAGVPTERNPR